MGSCLRGGSDESATVRTTCVTRKIRVFAESAVPRTSGKLCGRIYVPGKRFAGSCSSKGYPDYPRGQPVIEHCSRDNRLGIA